MCSQMHTERHIHKAHTGLLLPHQILKCACLWLYCSIVGIIITVLGAKARIKIFESFVFSNRNISAGLDRPRKKCQLKLKNNSFLKSRVFFIRLFVFVHIYIYICTTQKTKCEEKAKGVGTVVVGSEVLGISACSFTH